MTRLTFVEPDGRRHDVDADDDMTVMEAAIDNGVDGIEAVCGGGLSCATCHVYVDDAWVDRLPKIEVGEEQMLGTTAAPRQPNSRLSCQLDIEADVDGLVVHLPPFQS
ncbi:MAG: 2Fe-2S iron-sulfur cluster-binding protein [Pseudomonadota bacterium]